MVVKFTVVVAPPQVVRFAGWFTCAVGFTVIVETTGVPTQVTPLLMNVGVTGDGLPLPAHRLCSRP